MSTPKECRYTDEHEWAKAEGSELRIGITDYAQEQLGDVVFVELPQVGAALVKGQSIANVESVKAVSDVYAPVDGTVTDVNAKLSKSPELINSSPYDEGWLITVKPSSMEQFDVMMDAAAYEAYVKEVSK